MFNLSGEPGLEREAAALLREDLLKIFRAGAFSAAIFAFVIGIVEFAWYGLEYWGSLLTSLGTGSMAGLFFFLSYRGHDLAASWVLIVGVWCMVMIDTAIQAGTMTQSVAALPLMVLVGVWLTGNAFAVYLLAAASVAVLFGIEVMHMQGIIEPHGVSHPYVGVMVIALILFVGAYVSLSIYATHMKRLLEQQRLARDLADSEYEYRRILDSSVDPYYRADLEGNIVTMSPTISRITGYTSDELIGQRLTEFYADPSQREQFVRLLRENEGEVRHFEAELVDKDGGTVWVSTNASYWRDPDGNIMGVEGTVRDITDWRQLREKMEKAGRIEVLDQLSGGLAHNFNNLLAIIQGNAEMIRGSNDPEEIQRLVSVIDQAADRGVDLTRRMMSFSSRAIAEDAEALNPNELIREIQPILETSLNQDIELMLELAEDLWMTEAFVGEFEDAVINLVLNSRDAIVSAGKVTVSTRNETLGADYSPTNPEWKRGDYVAVEVEDNGEGVPARILDKLIEPFFTTKPRNAGTGLGLSMVYGFLRRIGGDIQIRSAPGLGTRVTLYLPRAEDGAPEVASDRETQAAGGPERVLVVEDEPSLRDLNEKRLQKMGYATLAVDTGVAARDVLASDEPVDIVFSDVVMPGGISGFDLVDIVRDLRPGTPIVLCTGYVDEASPTIAREPFKILRKPFSNQDLAAAIREELDAARKRSTVG